MKKATLDVTSLRIFCSSNFGSSIFVIDSVGQRLPGKKESLSHINMQIVKQKDRLMLGFQDNEKVD